MSRELVIRFLEQNFQFTSEDFRRFMFNHGYKIDTANKWLWKLQQEQLIKRIMRNRRRTIYQSLIYKNKGEEGNEK